MYIFGVLALLWLIIYIAFRTPAVQDYLTGIVEDKASQQLNTKVSLGGIDIDFLDEIVLEDLYVEDQQGDTLLYSGKFRVAFNAWAALDKTISIDIVEIRNTYINLYQIQGSDSLNFEFIPEAFADTTQQQPQDTTSSAWAIQASELLLSDIRFDYDADSTQMQLALQKLNLLFDKIALEEEIISASEIDIDGLVFSMLVPATSADTTAQQESDTTDSNVINPSGFTFEVGLLTIANSKVGYQVGQQPSEDSLAGQMNFENLALADIQTTVENVFVGATELSLDMPNMSFVEANSGFRLEEFSAQATLDMPSVQATVRELRTANSELNGTIEYGMQLTDNTAEMMNSIRLQSELNEMELGLQDVSYFSNALEAYPTLSQLKARLSWQISIADGQGTLDRLLLTVPGKAEVLAEASFRELSALDTAVDGSPYVNFHLNELTTDYAFLSTILDDSTAQYLDRFQQKSLSMTAHVEGYLDNIDGNLTLQTGLGRLVANASYQEEGNSAVIAADLNAQQFDMRSIMLALGNPDSVASAYGPLTMQADLRAVPVYGNDTTIRSLNADLLVQNFTYNGYTYEGLRVEARKELDAVTAMVDYEDSLLQMHADAEAVLRGADSKYKLDLQLQNANLFRLNLLQDSIIITDTRLTAEASGNSVQNIEGKLKVNNADIIRGAERFQLDSMVVLAEKTDTSQTFSFASTHVDASLTGQFDLAQLPEAFSNFQQYYLSAYDAPLNQQDTIHTFGTNQEIFLDVEIRDTPLLAQVFAPSLKVVQPVTANAYFNSELKKLTFRFYAPNVFYADYNVDSLLITAQTSQRAIRFSTKSDFVRIGTFTLPELSIEGNFSGAPKKALPDAKQRLFATEADLNLKIGAEGAPYRLDLNTVLSSSQDTITVRLDSSELVLEDEPWRFSRNTSITYADSYLAIDSFYLQQDEQMIKVFTENQQGTTDLRLLIEQLATGPLLASLDLEDYAISGLLNAEASFGDMFTAGNLEAMFTIDSLRVREMPVGTLQINAAGEGLASAGASEPLNLEMTLDGENNALAVEGTYQLDSSYFDIGINMERFQLDPWQAFLQESVEQMEGVLTADLQLQGTPDDPSITGTFSFADEVTLVPTITGAVYYINNQQIAFEGDEIIFDNFVLEDSARTEATLDGSISIANLSNPVFNLSFDTDDFLFVNNESYENESFYGRAFATAFLEIENALDNLQVSGDVSINEGTDFYISLVSEAETASQADYVTFVDTNYFLKEDTVATDSVTSFKEVEADSAVNISGFSLNTDVSISPEAQITIILDPVNGDQITASGDADLNVIMNPDGEVNIQGAYVIESGQYVLTFAQLIQKEFQIREGSTLVWSGDPTNAQFDITAIYTAETTLEDLVSGYSTGLDGLASSDYITTLQPVNVVMMIDGNLTEPELDFDIEIPEMTAQGVSAEFVQNVISQLERDQTAMYKQVFGLIVLNRFIPTSGGFGSSSTTYTSAVNERIDNSLSRLLSGTLSELTEEYLGGVQINMDIESDQLQAQNTALADRNLDVMLSKGFFNDRLQVSLGGMTSLNTNSAATPGTSGASDNQFYGEFEILYRLDTKGNLNIRIFQESDRNIFSNEVRQIQGVSLSYQKAFDEFFEDDSNVIESRPAPEEEEDQNEEQEDTESTALDNAQRRKKLKKP